MTSHSEPQFVVGGVGRLLADALQDAEWEVQKLRKLLVVKLCDCRRMSNTLPLEPVMHSPKCTYRSALE